MLYQYYPDFLVGLLALGGLRRCRQMVVCAVVLWLNCRLLTALDDQFNWVANASADYTSAIIIVAFAGGGRRVALVVLSFGVALLWHVMHGILGLSTQLLYWHEMSVTAWLQALVTLSLATGGGIGRLRSSLRWHTGPGRIAGALGLGDPRARLRRWRQRAR